MAFETVDWEVRVTPFCNSFTLTVRSNDKGLMDSLVNSVISAAKSCDVYDKLNYSASQHIRKIEIKIAVLIEEDEENE
jgi:hypothetical protein